MYWMDGFTFDDNLINSSFLSGDSNGELSDNNHRLSRTASTSSSTRNRFRSSSSSNRKVQNLRGLASTSKAKRRRHAHFKLNNRLDRKSSRGMVYENEELRLRTININAEVERGQSDIKRLRKENDHLRREIWSLRDEYDRLNKRFKTKFIEADNAACCNARCSQGGCSCQCNEGGGGGCDMGHSKCNSEDSDSCHSCCCNDTEEIVCTDDCCNETKNGALALGQQEQSPTDSSTKLTITECGQPPPPPSQTHPAPAPLPSILTNFDHLSVVSEETLSNSDVLTVNTENLLVYTPDISGSQTTLPSLVGPLTPLTPIELVANELNDIQAKVPPLSYFENVLQQHMSSNFSSTPGTSSSNSGKTVIRHTNGWDYNIQSPFSQKRYPANSISPILQQRSAAQTLSTFVPTTTVTPPPPAPPGNSSEKTPLKSKSEFPGPANTSQVLPLIETVPITTMPINNGCGGAYHSSTNSNANDANGNGQLGKPKHFFAPIKPKLKLNTALANQRRMPPPPPPVAAPSTKAAFTNGIMGNEAPAKCEPPDIYVTNGLATPYKHPVKPTVQPPPIPQRITSNATSAQTDSANLEAILNDIEAISEDILAIQLEKSKSRDNLDCKTTTEVKAKANAPLKQTNKNSKPYRSEMNLLLTYDGDNPTIVQAYPAKHNKSTTENGVENGTARRTRSLEREHTDSPSPNIPDPMQPFPENRKYIGFDHLNRAVAAAAVASSTAAPLPVTTAMESPKIAVTATATQTSPVVATPLSHRTHLPLSPLVTNVNMPMQSNGKPMPPAPPARSFPSPLNIKCAGIQRSSSVTYKPNAMQSPTGSPILGGVHPNKSQLFSAIANAAAKRSQFRSQPTHMTRSLDTDCLLETTNENTIQSEKEEKEITEFAKRKARRVSIVCADTDSPGTPDKPTPSVRTMQSQNSITASCSDLPTVMPNPALRNFKQPSLSTPNSPHSSRKHEGSPLNTSVQQQQQQQQQHQQTPTPPIISITPTTPQHQHGRALHGSSNGLPHHHSHSISYPNAVASTSTIQQQRKNSQDTIKASAAEIACAAANAVRSKCSRRHSEGTVSHTNQRSSGASGGTNGGHHHGHHNHHHHQHSSSLVSNSNPHHSHHSHQDSNHETVASCSDRNSNSLASSRESSASFSMRSTRRKLSVSSNTGGKIPWCGCWGNGCL
ncbi:mucin-2 isoform X6 [Stomoxys calcitrans]|uniref:mucin-2 isoform X6 n=1 Tax=Stomoxys calcitrans TaxID=35570 RepID=UPI0027E2F28C|nr:mucin-2 isoform X6 [Stomoxys calcitrans]